MKQDWLAARAMSSPNVTALVGHGPDMTFGQLSHLVDRLAKELSGQGVTAGNRIGIIAGGRTFAAYLHALSRLGAVAVPLNARLLPEHHLLQLGAAGASGLLFEEGAEATVAAAAEQAANPGHREHSLAYRDGLDAFRVGYLRLHPKDEHVHRPSSSDASIEDQLHSIMFTSGTTGAGKGVRLTYANHWWNALGSLMNAGSEPSDLWLDCLPLHHVGGLSILLRSVLYGVPVELHSRFDPEAVNSSIDNGRITRISLVSTMLERMLDVRKRLPFPPSLRCVLLGGGPAPRALIEESLSLAIPIAPTYGLTESASQAATLLPQMVGAHIGSSGRALLGTEIAIAPSTETHKAIDHAGEIVLRGPSVTPGYLPPNKNGWSNGWFHTGDLGRLDVDGYLTVIDRIDDLIITGGENVSPTEIESVLAAHPAVAAAGVVGIDDRQWGEAVTAAVVLRDQTVRDSELMAFCNSRLPRYKCPKFIRRVDELPLNSSGKLLRRELRHSLGNQLPEATSVRIVAKKPKKGAGMEFEDVVLKRRMVRHFTEEPVPRETVEHIVEIAQRAPSAGFSQGVSFVAVTDPKLRQAVAQLAGEEGYTNNRLRPMHPFISEAPVQIVLCTSEKVYKDRYREPDKATPGEEPMEWPSPYWHTDAGCAMMLLLLAAVDQELSGAFVGLWDIDGMRSLLGIPEHFHPVGIVLIGHGAPDVKSPSLKRGRRELSDVLHHNRW